MITVAVSQVSAWCLGSVVGACLAVTAMACQVSDAGSEPLSAAVSEAILVVRVVGFETRETVLHESGRLELMSWSRHGLSSVRRGQVDVHEVTDIFETLQLQLKKGELFRSSLNDPDLEDEELLQVLLVRGETVWSAEGAERLAQEQLLRVLGWLSLQASSPLEEAVLLAWLRPAAPLLGLTSPPDEPVLAIHEIPHLRGVTAPAAQRSILERLAGAPLRAHALQLEDSAVTELLANKHVRWNDRDYEIFSAKP